jgi:peptidoglycan/xylan/chitin deacetylase (PgdA/CDA1 family)
MGLITKSKAAFRKTYPDMRALLTRQYPPFVYGARLIGRPASPFPVFCFHGVEWSAFEAILGYLTENGYRTFDSDEWLEAMGRPFLSWDHEVLLTFDDGDISLYRTAFPLLKKYGAKAISFICPGLVPDDGDAARADRMLCTWGEIREMHDSGVIDFQCHTYNHDLIFTADSLVGFLNPAFASPYFGKDDHPIAIDDGEDLSFTNICSFRGQTAAEHWGAPIYEHKPRLAATQRYIVSPDLRNRLIGFVRDNGGTDFFHRPDWERLLREQLSSEKATARGKTVIGKAYQAHVAMELERAIETIQAKLPGRKVQHLCPPWFAADEAALQTAEDLGFRAAFLGVESHDGKREPGAMHRVQRLSYKYITRLPGAHRASLLRTVLDRSG